MAVPEEFTVVLLMVVEPVALMDTPDPAEETVKLLETDGLKSTEHLEAGML